MLTRGPDVTFQKNTFLRLASVCLSCQNPLFCVQLSLSAPPSPLPHLKRPPLWLALVLKQKEGKALRIYVGSTTIWRSCVKCNSLRKVNSFPYPSYFYKVYCLKNSHHLYKCGHNSCDLCLW